MDSISILLPKCWSKWQPTGLGTLEAWQAVELNNRLGVKHPLTATEHPGGVSQPRLPLPMSSPPQKMDRCYLGKCWAGGKGRFGNHRNIPVPKPHFLFRREHGDHWDQASRCALSEHLLCVCPWGWHSWEKKCLAFLPRALCYYKGIHRSAFSLPGRERQTQRRWRERNHCGVFS